MGLNTEFLGASVGPEASGLSSDSLAVALLGLEDPGEGFLGLCAEDDEQVFQTNQ